MFHNEQDFSFKRFITHLTTRKAISNYIVLGIALISVAIYLYTATFMLWNDAPRFLGAIITLGIANPAEPVYVFLAHFFIYLPFGSILFRVQIFSALLAGGTLLLLYRLVISILEKPILLRKKNQVPLKQPPLLLAGIFSMLVLAFSYQFWSQAQNVETFIFDCFIELVVLNLLLSEIAYKTVFMKLAIVVSICGIATGTDPPVIASIFPSVLSVAWYWKAGLGKKRLFILFLLGLGGIVLAWSYLPIMASRHPLQNYMRELTVKGVWDIATGQDMNLYVPQVGLANGLTWSPTIMMTSAWQYLVMAWMDFTPIILPLIILGGVYLWRYQRRTFIAFFLVVITNFIFSCLYLSGNQESWFLQSDVVFAVFAGVGCAWIIEVISARIPKLDLRITQAGLLTLALIPLVYWWQTLDRHSWNITQDYIDNFYKPIKSPAIVIGQGDVFDAVSSYEYAATSNKHQVIPLWVNYLATSEQMTLNLAKKAHIRLPNLLSYNQDSIAGYRKFMNDFFGDNIHKYHIYLTQQAYEDILLNGGRERSLQIDPDRFRLVPVGLLQEVVPKNAKSPFNLNDFFYRWNNGFPKTQPNFLEHIYTSELQNVIIEVAISYDNAANYLMYQGQYDKAGSFYQKAYSLEPNNVQILGDLGTFYGRQNQPEKALTYFTKAHASQPYNETWLYNIALAKGQLGKIDDEKKDLKSIIDNPNIDSSYKQALTEQLNSLNQKANIPEPSIRHKTLSAPSGWKQFTNTAMNLAFIYPQTLQVTQTTSQLISLSDPSHPDMKDELLIYSTVMSSGNLSDVTVLFLVPGQLQQSNTVQFPGFQAVMDVYSDTTEQTLVLVLQQGQQVFAIRFPEPTAFTPDVLDQIVQSITSLH